MQIKIKLNKNFAKEGYTMVEIVFVIMMISILGGIATLKYIDLRSEASEGKLNNFLGSIRTAISNANNSLTVVCHANNDAVISRATLISNDLTTMPQCSNDDFDNFADRKVLEYGNFPENPINGLSTIGPCSAGREPDCNVLGSGNYFDSGYGWCYTSEGEFFAALSDYCSW